MRCYFELDENHMHLVTNTQTVMVRKTREHFETYRIELCIVHDIFYVSTIRMW